MKESKNKFCQFYLEALENEIEMMTKVDKTWWTNSQYKTFDAILKLKQKECQYYRKLIKNSNK